MDGREKMILGGGRGAGRTIIEKLARIAEGNPGCGEFLVELVNLHGGMEAIRRLELYEIRGSRAYQLWNDCCDRNAELAAEILALTEAGKISEEELHEHIYQPWGLKFDMEEIRKREASKIHGVKKEISGRDYAMMQGMGHDAMDAILNRTYEEVATKAFRNFKEDAGKTFMVKVFIEGKPDGGVVMKLIKEEVPGIEEVKGFGLG